MNWVDRNMGWIIAAGGFGLIALLVIWLGTAMGACGGEKRKLVAECEASGKPHFECVAMFQHYCSGGCSSTVAPMIIPVGR